MFYDTGEDSEEHPASHPPLTRPKNEMNVLFGFRYRLKAAPTLTSTLKGQNVGHWSFHENSFRCMVEKKGHTPTSHKTTPESVHDSSTNKSNTCARANEC